MYVDSYLRNVDALPEGKKLYAGINHMVSRAPVKLRYIDYTESGESHGSWFSMGLYTLIIHFGRVILCV